MSRNLRAEFDSLTRTAGPLSRRGFVTLTGAAMGFAAAAGPVAARSVISTGTDGLSTGEGEVPTFDDRTLPVYYARPEGQQLVPTILVVQEIFGLHEYIRDVCRRLAHLGYLAVAPELYFRQGDPSAFDDIQALLRELVAQVPDHQVLADLDAAATWATAELGGDAMRLGITGFCWGGRVTWLYAAHNPDVRAGVAWYGRLVGETSERQPQHPIDVAQALHAPVLGLYGEADSGIPLETVEAMREQLRQAGHPSEIIVFPEAPHAFHADYRPSYREEAATQGWARLTEWFERHL